jgi:hypothetical protein
MEINNRMKNQTGVRSGKLTVIEWTGNYTKAGNAIWECKCDCGGTILVPSGHLSSGHVRSCGCTRSLEKGKASFNRLLHIYKKGARTRNKEWSLSIDQFKALTKGSCHYCGQEPSMSIMSENGNGEYIYNGIDRKDNKEGYTPENSVSCCNQCNKAKASLSYEAFMKWISRLTKHQISFIH